MSDRWALQVAGCPYLFLSHGEYPTVGGLPLAYTITTGGATTPYGRAAHVIDAESTIVFQRRLDIDRGVVDTGELTLRLLRKPRSAGDPCRWLGRRGVQGVDWYAEVADTIDVADDTPTFDIIDKGQSTGAILHVGPEAFIVDSTSVVGDYIRVTTALRGALGTPRITHRADPLTGRAPLCTPQPITWRGRRVLLWRAKEHAPSGLGRWLVRWRGDVDTDAAVGVDGIAVRLVSLIARTTMPVGSTIEPRRMHRTYHTFGGNIGCWVRVFATADTGALWQGITRAQINVNDPVITVDDGADFGGVAADDRHAAVAALPADPSLYGHPRTVPIRVQDFAPTWMSVLGYIAGANPQFQLTAGAYAFRPLNSGLRSAPMGESVYTRLVDTSGGPVTLRHSAMLNTFNTSPLARSTELFGGVDGDTYGQTFANIRARRTVDGDIWQVHSKVEPHDHFVITLAGGVTQFRDADQRYRLQDNRSVEGEGWYRAADDVPPLRAEVIDGALLSPLVWSWADPEATASARAAHSGRRPIDGQRHELLTALPPQTVRLEGVGDVVNVPRAPLPLAWYGEFEPYITLDGPVGVGAEGQLAIEVREDGDDAVIARFLATAETEVSTGVWRVTVAAAFERDPFFLPTLVEPPGQGKRYTFTPAFVAEGAPPGEIAARLLTSYGGAGYMSEYDTEAFGAGLRDGTGALDTSVMGRDLDVSSVLALPALAGATSSVLGRPGDSVGDLFAGFARAAGYVLDMVTTDNPDDPHDGCLVALRPIGVPTRAEVRGAISDHDVEGRSIRMVETGLRNAIVVSTDFRAGGDGAEPGIVIRATSTTSVWAHGERYERDLPLPGLRFGSRDAAIAALTPLITRQLAENAFPRDRYRLEVRSTIAERMGIGDAWEWVSARAPRSDGGLGVSGVVRVVAVSASPREAFSEVTLDYYGDAAGNRAPALAVVDVISAVTVKVAPVFFGDDADPLTGSAQTDAVTMFVSSALAPATPVAAYDTGDPDTRRNLTVSTWSTATSRVTFTGAHGFADPGAEVDPADFIGVIEPRPYASSTTHLQTYFHHGRDPIT